LSNALDQDSKSNLLLVANILAREQLAKRTSGCVAKQSTGGVEEPLCVVNVAVVTSSGVAIANEDAEGRKDHQQADNAAWSERICGCHSTKKKNEV
jgi:hypothetical protein